MGSGVFIYLEGSHEIGRRWEMLAFWRNFSRWEALRRTPRGGLMVWCLGFFFLATNARTPYL
jgi:hypothetical protein